MTTSRHKPAKTPLAGYRGGKSRLLSRLLQLLPVHSCYVEPFCGAAWLFFAKSPSPIEVLNDINGDIVNLFRVIRDEPEAFRERCRHVLRSRRLFEEARATLAGEAPPLERAFSFWYLLKCCHAGRLNYREKGPKKLYLASFGTRRKSKSSWPACKGRSQRLGPLAQELDHWWERLQNVFLEDRDWREILQRYDAPTTFFYIDPPYQACEKNYGAAVFAPQDFQELAERLQKLKGKFMLSINDSPDTRQLFSKFEMEQKLVPYSFNPKNRSPKPELVIRNY